MPNNEQAGLCPSGSGAGPERGRELIAVQTGSCVIIGSMSAKKRLSVTSRHELMEQLFISFKANKRK